MSRFIAKKPKQSRVAHSAINPELLTSATAQLFSTRSLNEGQVFRGRIVAAETATPHLNSLFAQRSRFRFGRAKTRGMGAVDLRIAPLGSEFTEDPSRIAARLENMQTTAAQIAGRLAGKTVVTVTLQTPALVWDDFLLAPEWLSPVDVLLNETDGWKLAAWFSETAAISGWHAAAGVPKTEVFALQAGSCFAFAKTGPANTGLLAQWAARIQRGGIGERTQEGFGEVVVCHQIHFAPAGGNA
jgi:CRISPR-associated protein Csx10